MFHWLSTINEEKIINAFIGFALPHRDSLGELGYHTERTTFLTDVKTKSRFDGCEIPPCQFTK